MASPAKIANHPIHPMLVVFPLGLLDYSLVCDLIYIFGWGGEIWRHVAFYTMAGGIIGALVAAVPGLLDYISVSRPRVKQLGTTHMLINLSAVAIFILDFWLRTRNVPVARQPVILSVIGVILLCISGWLGGEMVYVHGQAVTPQSDATSIGRQPQGGELKRVA